MAELTPAQLRTLRADFIARGITGVRLGNPGAEAKLLAIYNADAAPTKQAWRNRLSVADLYGVYVWSELDTLSQPKQFQYQLILQPGYLDLTVANIRSGLMDVFSGPELAATRAAIVQLAKRKATVFEALYADDSTPAVLAVEGPMTIEHAREALAVS